MTLMAKFKLLSRRFAQDESGSMVAEGVMAFTLLIWWYMASFTFFDALRQKNINLKAAYTVADMVSRETAAINQTYVKGLNTVFDYLTSSKQPTWLRVTSVEWDEPTKSNLVVWSCTSDAAKQKHDNASIAALKSRIPVMPDGDTVIVMETFMSFTPIFKIGNGPANYGMLDPSWFGTFITTRPRFASQVVLSGTC